MHHQPFPRKPLTNDKPAGRVRVAGVFALPAPAAVALAKEEALAKSGPRRPTTRETSRFHHLSSAIRHPS